MNIITFKSSSKSKLDLLVKVAKEMGIQSIKKYELSDEEMAVPGSRVGELELEEWLAKGDGKEEYTNAEMLNQVKKELAKSRRRKNEDSLQTTRKKRNS